MMDLIPTLVDFLSYSRYGYRIWLRALVLAFVFVLVQVSMVYAQRGKRELSSREAGERMVRNVVRRHQPQLRVCVSDMVLVRNRVRVDARVTVDPKGSVKKVKIKGVDRAFAQGCLESRIKRWHFPTEQMAKKQEGEQSYTFPVVFRSL